MVQTKLPTVMSTYVTPRWAHSKQWRFPAWLQPPSSRTRAGTSGFRKPHSTFDHIQNQGAEAVCPSLLDRTQQDAGMARDSPRAQPRC